ncbi:MAG: DUF503 domain-containing protein [Terriglobales bacterium]
MPVAWIRLQLFLPDAASLKDRRQLLTSAKARLRHRFNVSVAELDDEGLWQRATLGIAAIASDARVLQTQLEQAAAEAEDALAGQRVTIDPVEFLD